jgi:hypothetical protein
MPSERQKRQRANILSGLRNEPASTNLQAYFERLKKGSPTWDIETFVEGANTFAKLCGPARAKYYDNPLKGLRSANSFTKRWNETYPEEPITLWDRDIRHQCPASWTNALEGVRCFLTYRGEGAPSQALNELIQGPTTLDCGMFCQLLLWMAIRYLVGDGLFDRLFEFGQGHFTLMQNWEESPLFAFYDEPSLLCGSEARIQTRTVFNHPEYLARHPGGESRLHNVTRIDGYNIVFDPDAPQNILSDKEIEERLRQAYNAPRDFADLEKLWMYTAWPGHVHPDFAPKDFGTLAEEANKYAHHTLDAAEWNDGRVEREKSAHGLRFTFNFQRLVRYLEAVLSSLDAPAG